MATLYDILGVPEDADVAELRHAYYRAARRLHPDVNQDVDTTEDMRRLNRAWTVLGDPEARRAYDYELHRVAPDADRVPLDEEPVYPDGPVVSSLARLVRPSALILAVLLVIFVVTAYVGPKSNDRTRVPPSGSVVPSGRLGQCLKMLPGYDAVVPCTQPNDGRVVADVGNVGQCPPATHRYQLAGTVQIVCLDQSGR
jgi:hypothetical protein